MEGEVQYVTDINGVVKNVILPIEYWRRINCDEETEFLFQSLANKDRLIEALNRKDYLSKEEVYARLSL